jgi:hypothetical protein
MTLHSQNEFSIPEETARVARAAYPKRNLYMNMRDGLGTIYQDESFAHLFPSNGLCWLLGISVLRTRPVFRTDVLSSQHSRRCRGLGRSTVPRCGREPRRFRLGRADL